MEGRTITRADLSESVFQEVGLSRNESSDLVETILSEVAGLTVQSKLLRARDLATLASERGDGSFDGAYSSFERRTS